MGWHLQTLSYFRQQYIKMTWLCYKDRFILAWTKAYRHLGNASINRAEGQHGAVTSRIVVSTGNLADVYQRILLAVGHQDKVIRHSIAYSCAHMLIALSGDIWTDIRRKISHHALKKAHEEVNKARISPSTLCTNVFTSTRRIPCPHRVRNILATRGRFQKEAFFQWWLDRNENTCHEDTTDLTLEPALSQIRDRYSQLIPHQQRILLDHIILLSREEVLVEVNEPPPVRQGRSRPVGARGRCVNDNVSTRRDQSSFEHALLQTEAV